MKSCFNLMRQVFGQWKVISKSDTKKPGTYWNCVCTCGNYCIVSGSDLRRGYSKRCVTCATVTHGKTNTRLYVIWCNMKRRCTSIVCKDFPNYGGRGITVCDRWMHSFQNFFEDMGESPQDMTLDRIDNDKGYFPENCRWADSKTQRRNSSTFVKDGTIRNGYKLIERCEDLKSCIIKCISCGDIKKRSFGRFRMKKLCVCICSHK